MGVLDLHNRPAVVAGTACLLAGRRILLAGRRTPLAVVEDCSSLAAVAAGMLPHSSPVLAIALVHPVDHKIEEGNRVPRLDARGEGMWEERPMRRLVSNASEAWKQNIIGGKQSAERPKEDPKRTSFFDMIYVNSRLLFLCAVDVVVRIGSPSSSLYHQLEI